MMLTKTLWFDSLVAQAWQVLALAVIVGILTRTILKNRAHWSHALWLVVLLKCIVPPVMSSPVGLFSWWETPWPSPTRQVPSQAAAQPMPKLAWDNDVTVSVDASEATKDDDFVATRVARPLEASNWSWANLAISVWVGGIVIAMGVTLASWLHWGLLLRRRRVACSPELERMVQQIRRRAGIRVPVRLWITSSRIGPAVIGLIRPTIVLPQLLVTGRSPRQLEPILAHEMIHVRRGDLWFGLLQLLARSIGWCHPIVWWVVNTSSRNVERCCDEEVIQRLGIDPRRYAECLIDVLERKRSLSSLPAVPGVKPVEITSERLERIMRMGHGSRQSSSWLRRVVIIGIASITLPGAVHVAGSAENGDVSKQDTDRAASSTSKPHVVTYDLGEILGVERLDEKSKDQVLAAIYRVIRPPFPQIDNKNKLVVVANSQQHETIRQLLDHMQTFGTDDFTVSLRFIRTTPELERQLVGRWQLQPLQNDFEVGRSTKIEQRMPKDLGRTNRVGMVTETRLPTLFKIVDADELEGIFARVRDSAESNMMEVPQVRILSGQSASILDSTQRPLVVGVREGKPQIRVVEEGLIARIRPRLEDDELQLAYEVTLSDILEVQETTIEVEGVDRPLTLQIPKIQTMRVESSVSVPKDRTLILGGLPSKTDNGEPGKLLIVMRVRSVNRYGDDPNEIEPSDLGNSFFFV